MSGGGDRYDDQYESPGGAFGDGNEFVTTSPLYLTSHAWIQKPLGTRRLTLNSFQAGVARALWSGVRLLPKRPVKRRLFLDVLAELVRDHVTCSAAARYLDPLLFCRTPS